MKFEPSIRRCIWVVGNNTDVDVWDFTVFGTWNVFFSELHARSSRTSRFTGLKGKNTSDPKSKMPIKGTILYTRKNVPLSKHSC